MTRNYVAVQAVLPHRPKFRRLSIPARAALFTVWCDATTRTPEAIWKSRAELADVLELDGFGPDVISELMDRGWLDALEDGRVAVHDWDDHQVALSREMTRAYEAARKFDWRKRQPLSPNPSPVGEVRGEEGRVSPHVPERPGHVRDTNGRQYRPTIEEAEAAFERPNDTWGVLPTPPGLPSPEGAARFMADIRAELENRHARTEPAA